MLGTGYVAHSSIQSVIETHLAAYFEVRHPRCVSQITKLNNRRLEVKTQLYYIIYIRRW